YDVELEMPKNRHEVGHPVDLQKVADQILLNRFAPPSVVVNDKLEIVQFIGQTGRYLDPIPGDATLHLLKLVKGGLQLELRLAFQRVKRTGTLRKEGVLVELDGAFKTVNFEILPVKNLPGRDRFYLVVFEEAPIPPKAIAPKSVEKIEQNKGSKSKPTE